MMMGLLQRLLLIKEMLVKSSRSSIDNRDKIMDNKYTMEHKVIIMDKMMVIIMKEEIIINKVTITNIIIIVNNNKNPTISITSNSTKILKII